MIALQCQSCKREGISLLYPTSDDLTRHCLCGHTWLPAEDVMVEGDPEMFKKIEVSTEDFQKLYGWSVK